MLYRCTGYVGQAVAKLAVERGHDSKPLPADLAPAEGRGRARMGRLRGPSDVGGLVDVACSGVHSGDQHVPFP